jgi:hypothetical protein
VIFISGHAPTFLPNKLFEISLIARHSDEIRAGKMKMNYIIWSFLVILLKVTGLSQFLIQLLFWSSCLIVIS